MRKYTYIREVISTEVTGEANFYSSLGFPESMPMKTGRIKRVVQFTNEYDEMYCSVCDTWEPPGAWHICGTPVEKFVCIHCGHTYYVEQRPLTQH